MFSTLSPAWQVRKKEEWHQQLTRSQSILVPDTVQEPSIDIWQLIHRSILGLLLVNTDRKRVLASMLPHGPNARDSSRTLKWATLIPFCEIQITMCGHISLGLCSSFPSLPRKLDIARTFYRTVVGAVLPSSASPSPHIAEVRRLDTKDKDKDVPIPSHCWGEAIIYKRAKSQFKTELPQIWIKTRLEAPWCPIIVHTQTWSTKSQR